MGLFGSDSGGGKVKVDWTPQQRDYIESITGFADDSLLPYLEKLFKGQQTYPGAYDGERVAGFTGREEQAADLLGTNADRTAAGYDELLGGGGFGLDAALANNPALIDKLYNPQAERVIDATLADMADTYGQEQAKLGLEMGNAWNGSAAGIAKGQLAGDYTRAVGTVGSQMRKDAFDTASGLAARDLDRWQTGVGLKNDALKGQAGSNVAAGNALLGVGNQERGIDQARNDVGYGNFLEERDWGWGLLGKANNAMPGNLPGMSQADTSTGGSGGPSKAAGALQGAAGGAAAGTAIMPGYGTAIGAGIGAISGLASDERLKTDMEPVGSLPIYAYRFVDEPPGTEHVGPMAQDVARVMPEAVTQTEDGILAIQPYAMAGGRTATDPNLQRLAQMMGLDGLTGVQMAPMAPPQGDMNDMGFSDQYQGEPDPRIAQNRLRQEAGIRGLSPAIMQVMRMLGYEPSASDQAIGAQGQDFQAENMDYTPSSAQRAAPQRPTSRRVLPQFREQPPGAGGGGGAPMAQGREPTGDNRSMANQLMAMFGGGGAAPMPQAKPQAMGPQGPAAGARPAAKPAGRGIAAGGGGGGGTGWRLYDNPSDTPAHLTQPPARKPSPAQDRSLEPGMNENQVRAANTRINANRAANASYESILPQGQEGGGGLWEALAGMVSRGSMPRAGVSRG